MRQFVRPPSPTIPPATPADHKLKKANERLDRIELVETVDILAELSRQKGERCVIGFAAETDNVVEYAERKLARKGCDAIIANDVSRADSGFGTDTNKAWIVSTTGTQELPVLTKPQLARYKFWTCFKIYKKSSCTSLKFRVNILPVASESRATNISFGTWRSLVAHLTGGQGVAGSNPVVPTRSFAGQAPSA